MRTREYRRIVRRKKINGRKRMISNLAPIYIIAKDANSYMRKIHRAVYEDTGGLLSKHDYGAITSGCPTKTKAKNQYQTHRHKGSYGKAKQYSKHDKVQIESMDIDMNTYFQTNLWTGLVTLRKEVHYGRIFYERS